MRPAPFPKLAAHGGESELDEYFPGDLDNDLPEDRQKEI